MLSMISRQLSYAACCASYRSPRRLHNVRASVALRVCESTNINAWGPQGEAEAAAGGGGGKGGRRGKKGKR